MFQNHATRVAQSIRTLTRSPSRSSSTPAVASVSRAAGQLLHPSQTRQGRQQIAYCRHLMDAIAENRLLVVHLMALRRAGASACSAYSPGTPCSARDALCGAPRRVLSAQATTEILRAEHTSRGISIELIFRRLPEAKNEPDSQGNLRPINPQAHQPQPVSLRPSPQSPIPSPRAKRRRQMNPTSSRTLCRARTRGRQQASSSTWSPATPQGESRLQPCSPRPAPRMSPARRAARGLSLNCLSGHRIMPRESVTRPTAEGRDAMEPNRCTQVF